MVGDLARGIELIQMKTVSQISGLLSARGSPFNSPPKALRLTSSKEQQNILRVQVTGVRNLILLAIMIGIVKAKHQRRHWIWKQGSCSWDECIEFSRIHDYTSLKIKVGCNKSFGRFKVLASTTILLSSIQTLNKSLWLTLYKDKKHKYERGAIQVTFEEPGNVNRHDNDDQQDVDTMKSVCSGYLIKLVADLRIQVDERDQRLKLMQTYIDELLIRVLEKCPQVLENK
ncbi:hypothetical protein M3Y97_00201200 [Aphelenchoides bicaudatus]|nr:hypothetical protein M3Y97_00201200 [Aphelenchoides bicaudatus]